jgi:hypothetical protein
MQDQVNKFPPSLPDPHVEINILTYIATSLSMNLDLLCRWPTLMIFTLVGFGFDVYDDV